MKNKLALFGNPVQHSLSPQIHQQFAQQFPFDVEYELILAEEKNVISKVTDFFENGGLGCNITLPFKTLIYNSNLLDKLSETARACESVNTITKDKSGKLIGHNTDGLGFIKDLQQSFRFDIKQKKILILGAGGAVNSVFQELQKHQPDCIFVANRTLAKAETLCQEPNTYAVDLKQIQETYMPFDLIIHASSLGHQGQCLTFEPHHIHQNTIGYDLSYGNAAKAFLDFCHRKKVTKTQSGLGMLIQQAAYAFESWFGKHPQTNHLEFK